MPDLGDTGYTGQGYLYGSVTGFQGGIATTYLMGIEALLQAGAVITDVEQTTAGGNVLTLAWSVPAGSWELPISVTYNESNDVAGVRPYAALRGNVEKGIASAVFPAPAGAGLPQSITVPVVLASDAIVYIDLITPLVDGSTSASWTPGPPPAGTGLSVGSGTGNGTGAPIRSNEAAAGGGGVVFW